MSIYQKLLNIQCQLKAPKNQYNSFGGYHYRSCEDILEGLKPLLHENKAILVLTDDLVQVGDRYYIKATAKLIDVEKGESIESTAFAREAESKKKMDASQITGSASSYARKYALNGLFCIDDTKDADFYQGQVEDIKNPVRHIAQDNDVATAKQRKAIYAKAQNLSISADEMKKMMQKLYKKESSKMLTKQEASDLIKRLTVMEQRVKKQ